MLPRDRSGARDPARQRMGPRRAVAAASSATWRRVFQMRVRSSTRVATRARSRRDRSPPRRRAEPPRSSTCQAGVQRGAAAADLGCLIAQQENCERPAAGIMDVPRAWNSSSARARCQSACRRHSSGVRTSGRRALIIAANASISVAKAARIFAGSLAGSDAEAQPQPVPTRRGAFAGWAVAADLQRRTRSRGVLWNNRRKRCSPISPGHCVRCGALVPAGAASGQPRCGPGPGVSPLRYRGGATS